MAPEAAGVLSGSGISVGAVTTSSASGTPGSGAASAAADFSALDSETVFWASDFSASAAASSFAVSTFSALATAGYSEGLGSLAWAVQTRPRTANIATSNLERVLMMPIFRDLV